MRTAGQLGGAVAAATALLLALAGCAGDPAPSAALHDCGVEDQQMGTNLNVDGRECLLAAFEAGRPARVEDGCQQVATRG
jgi:hypothetical protein